jgi:hypothetical protein
MANFVTPDKTASRSFQPGGIYFGTVTRVDSDINRVWVKIPRFVRDFQFGPLAVVGPELPVVGDRVACLFVEDRSDDIVVIGVVKSTTSPFYSTPIVCTFATRPSSPSVGTIIYESDTEDSFVWSGASWVALGGGGAGTQGPQGYQGAAGAQGTQGAAGAQGFQGAAGAQGSQGPQGPQGSQGSQGTQGSQGPQGFQGTQGSQGTQGAQGSQGTQGTQGFQGAQGDSGANTYLKLAANTTTTTISNTTKTAFVSETIGGSTYPVAAGDLYILKAWGDQQNTNAAAISLTFEFQFGATTFMTSAAVSLTQTTGGAKRKWTAEVHMILPTLTSQNQGSYYSLSTQSTSNMSIASGLFGHAATTSSEDLSAANASKTLALYVTQSSAPGGSTTEFRCLGYTLVRIR